MSLTLYQPVQPADLPDSPSKREFVLSETRTRDALKRALTPIVDGLLIEGVTLTASVDATINHGLGRPLRGWLIVRNTAAGVTFDKQGANATPDKTLVLSTGTTKTVSLWVF